MTVALQLLGALSLGFAMLDWMARDMALGGIYGRPIVVANLLHFVSGALALVKALLRNPELRFLLPLAAVYVALAVGFGVMLRRHPQRAPAQTPGT